MRRWMQTTTGLLLLLSAVLAGCGPTTVTPTASETAPPTPEVEMVHQASGPGLWYPANAEALADMVDGYLDKAEQLDESIVPIALISPHAGFVYSGQVAAWAYKQIEGLHYDTIVLIGDTHSGDGSGIICIWPAGAFETPLGTIPVDAEVAQALIEAEPLITADLEAFANEHPIENQLPFLQRVCDDFEIVPIVFRESSLENARALAQALVKVLAERNALIVASTDLSHYPPYDVALAADAETLRAIESLGPEAVLENELAWSSRGLRNMSVTLCSQGAVLTAMIAAPELGANQAQTTRYANSGDVPEGDPRGVVGYGAVMFWQGESSGEQSGLPASTAEPGPLSLEDRGKLLQIARRTLTQYLTTGVIPQYQVTEPGLLQSRGAFVTLEEFGQLRGCIGNLSGQGPLYLTVQRMAIAAATEDRRFPPVSNEELLAIEIEVSVLSPLQLIDSADEIKVGRHGVVIVKDDHQAVFLPQVATEQGWDRETMLEELCLKAGLREDAWKENATFFVFTAEVFSE